MLYMEDYLQAIEDALTADLETQLLAVEARRSVEIPRWKVLTQFYSMARQYVKIEIIPGDETIDTGEDDAPIVELIRFMDASIFVSQVGPVDSKVCLTLARYVEAIDNIFEEVPLHNTLSGLVDWVHMVEVEWAEFAVVLEDRTLEFSVRIELQAKKHG